MDYEEMYYELMGRYTELQSRYNELVKKARKYRKAKKHWKNKWIRLSERLANQTADRIDKCTIEHIPKSDKNPYNEYWVIKNECGNIIWVAYTKDECERVIADGTLQRAIDECMIMCYDDMENEDEDC